MYHFNKIFAIAMIVLLTGCSIGGEKKIKIFSVEKPREKLNYECQHHYRWKRSTGIIITSENAEEVFKKLEEAGIDPVLFGITDKDFQVLARNFAQIRQKLQETNNLLKNTRSTTKILVIHNKYCYNEDQRQHININAHAEFTFYLGRSRGWGLGIFWSSRETYTVGDAERIADKRSGTRRRATYSRH